MANLKILFRSEAAGRQYNEDNGKILQLDGDKGLLLIVCDGMGGMKAGEVASALAVETIEGWFTPERLTSQVMSNPSDYLKQSIVGADTNIKNYSKTHPETEGMGSTAVLAWLIGEKAYVAWCGDSRAYRYNPQFGLERLSHDHSLVQSLVDAGQITEEQAFDHPQSNIITRSLGDPNGVAEPDTAEYVLYNNDVFLLCSDGLCGNLRDKEIEKILSENKDLSRCCEQLWQADKAAGWHDNVTTAMAQVTNGGTVLSMAQPEETESEEMEFVESSCRRGEWRETSMKVLKYVFVIALILCAVIFAYLYFSQKSKIEKGDKNIDTLQEQFDKSPEAPCLEPTHKILQVPNQDVVTPEPKKDSLSAPSKNKDGKTKELNGMGEDDGRQTPEPQTIEQSTQESPNSSSSVVKKKASSEENVKKKEDAFSSEDVKSGEIESI